MPISTLTVFIAHILGPWGAAPQQNKPRPHIEQVAIATLFNVGKGCRGKGNALFIYPRRSANDYSSALNA